MSACTFFGHHDCPAHVKPAIASAIVKLIEDYKVDTFYVGNHGSFDRIVYSALSLLAETYPHIDYMMVLAYLPRHDDPSWSAKKTILPEGIEYTPKRFAISWRNNWMIARSDFVIVYITHDWGGAAQFAEKALRQGKTVINIAEQ